MNLFTSFQSSARKVVLSTFILSSALSFSGLANAGAEASISILPNAQEQAEFLAKSDLSIDESLFENRFVKAATRTNTAQYRRDDVNELIMFEPTKSQWRTNRRQQHLYTAKHIVDSHWQFLSISMHQGDLELTMGNKYPKN